jgi:hypothetical protein
MPVIYAVNAVFEGNAGVAFRCFHALIGQSPLGMARALRDGAFRSVAPLPHTGSH